MTTLIVDSNSLYTRSFFAAQASNKADPTFAIQLALNTIIRILHPDINRLGSLFNGTLFAWDSGDTPEKRRAPKPSGFHEGKELLKETIAGVFGAANAQVNGYEGDDVVATAAARDTKTHSYYIVSGDKDLMQMVAHRVSYWCLNTKALLSDAYMSAKFHVKRPSQIGIALAICGDKVDKIPGIPGWGPAKVKKLFNKVDRSMDFGTALETVVGQIPEELRDLFYASLSRTLLNMQVPHVPPPKEIDLMDPLEFSKLGFKDLNYHYRELYQIYTNEPF